MNRTGAIDTRRNFNAGFFDDPPTKTALSRLADSQRVVIFAGAGVSADQNYPSWSGLVSSLLGTALNHLLSNQSAEEIERIAIAITSQYYQIPTATIIDQVYGQIFPGRGRQERDQELRRALYMNASQDDFTNPATLVARILTTALTLKATGVEVHIVTTNYDDLFEHTAKNSSAFQAFDDWDIEVRSFTEAPPGPRDDLTSIIPVVHVHGYLGRDPKEPGQNLVFSENDYIAWDLNSPFRDYLIRMFGGSDVLMLGTSLRDLNIAAKLQVSANPTYQRFALMPAQSELQAFRGVGKEFAEKVAQFAAYRGEQLYVNVLRPDFYGQVHQFIDELSYIKSRGADKHQGDYTTRLRAWSREWTATCYTSQTRMTDTTAELVGLSKTVADLCGARVQGVKSELWVRSQPESRRLELWCDSRAIRLIGQENYQRHEVEIDAYSDHAAVRCFAARAAIYGRINLSNSRRWTHFIAIPISTASGIQVGVATVMFWAPRDEAENYPPSLRSKWQEVTRAIQTVAENSLGSSLRAY